MKFSDAVAAYLAYIKYQRGLSPRTIVTYTSWLHHFEKWLEENGYGEPTIEVMATPVLTRFLHSLTDRRLRPRTIRSVFYPLRGLGDYLLGQNLILSSHFLMSVPRIDVVKVVGVEVTGCIFSQ